MFVTDQAVKDVRAYRKSSKQYIGHLVLIESTPYDVMMYSGARQEEMDNGRKLETRVCGFGMVISFV